MQVNNCQSDRRADYCGQERSLGDNFDHNEGIHWCEYDIRRFKLKQEEKL